MSDGITEEDIRAAVARLKDVSEDFQVPMTGAAYNPACPACIGGRYKMHHPQEAREYHPEWWQEES